jgi:hypothetical protein
MNQPNRVKKLTNEEKAQIYKRRQGIALQAQDRADNHVDRAIIIGSHRRRNNDNDFQTVSHLGTAEQERLDIEARIARDRAQDNVVMSNAHRENLERIRQRAINRPQNEDDDEPERLLASIVQSHVRR